MDIFRCILSGLLTLCSVVFLKYLSGTVIALMWLVAAVIFPYYLANKFVLGLGIFSGICGVIAFFGSAYVNAALAVAAAVIIIIKYKCMDNEYGFGGFSGFGGYSGGSYSSGGYDYEADRERRQQEEEDRERRQQEEEDRERRRKADEESQRRLDEVYEERRRMEEKELDAWRRRQEAEAMARRRYGCDANTASHWDNDINSRL